MQALLKPGALMSHATPCFQYLYEYTRFHLFFFPGRSLEVLAEAADLQVRSFTVDGHYMSAVFSPRAYHQ
jgi:acyl dehydratase